MPKQQYSKFITSGTQTYSKMACRYVEGVYPYFLEHGKGCYVYDDEGKMYVDYVASLGANLLGHAHPYVTEKVRQRLEKGTLFSLPSQQEGKLAEELNNLFPYMEQMRFLKSGSEAVSAAVKIARANTEREMIVSIGYHGWHDTFSASSPKSDGSPTALKPLCLNVNYNDYDALADIFKLDGNWIAALIMEPYVFEEPKDDFLRRAMNLADRYGTITILDEVVTGMRWRDYGVANYYELTPDLLVLGKPLANGLPLAVVGGKKRLMRVLDEDCFVSTTFGGDLLAIEAALATIDVCKKEVVPDAIYESGEDLKTCYNELAQELKLDTECFGNPARLAFKFPTDAHRALFWQECVKQGVLFGYATHTTLAHTPAIISKTVEVIHHAFQILKDNWENPAAQLEGKIPQRVEVVGSRR